ncbi:hypothetical protein EJ110_NYTH30846 [Nymphaea thermarum]|nr:hypothetical protein EJ110_NYTH30846 [Nymphaea thermarum]
MVMLVHREGKLDERAEAFLKMFDDKLYALPIEEFEISQGKEKMDQLSKDQAGGSGRRSVNFDRREPQHRPCFGSSEP